MIDLTGFDVRHEGQYLVATKPGLLEAWIYDPGVREHLLWSVNYDEVRQSTVVKYCPYLDGHRREVALSASLERLFRGEKLGAKDEGYFALVMMDVQGKRNFFPLLKLFEDPMVDDVHRLPTQEEILFAKGNLWAWVNNRPGR